MFSYSVVIRTLGNTGGKYLQMLQAINHQTIKPEEIVVVIPEGYDLDHSLGNERVLYSKKGMVTQRVVGMEKAKGDYLLVLDDDIDFPANFAEQMYNTLKERQLDCVLAFGREAGLQVLDGNQAKKIPFKKKIIQALRRIRLAYTGQAFYSRRKSKYYDTITYTGGHRTFVNCKEGLCQTGCFQCFFINAGVAKAVRFDEELWLQEGTITTYAAYDDAVFFYKLYNQGKRIAYARNTSYVHLDAAAGRPAMDLIAAKRIRLYSIARNRTIFWYRHIWSKRHDICMLVGGIYGIVNYAIYNILINLLPKYWPAIGALLKGYKDAFNFIRKS